MLRPLCPSEDCFRWVGWARLEYEYWCFICFGALALATRREGHNKGGRLYLSANSCGRCGRTSLSYSTSALQERSRSAWMDMDCMQ